ncbi:MAG: hypothetical protein IPN96_18070 [Anaerolineales bacterium]|nr:hypothetical protein [Anaerolineales bacterium]
MTNQILRWHQSILNLREWLCRTLQAALDIVKAGPEALNAPLAALGTEMAKLEQARLLVESTRLTAPFDGTFVTSLNAVTGQTWLARPQS